jgi:hypothetical protein
MDRICQKSSFWVLLWETKDNLHLGLNREVCQSNSSSNPIMVGSMSKSRSRLFLCRPRLLYLRSLYRLCQDGYRRHPRLSYLRSPYLYRLCQDGYRRHPRLLSRNLVHCVPMVCYRDRCPSRRNR